MLKSAKQIINHLKAKVVSLESERQKLACTMDQKDQYRAALAARTENELEHRYDAGYAAGTAAAQQDTKMLYAEAFSAGAGAVQADLSQALEANKKLKSQVLSLESALGTVGMPAEEPVGDAGTGEETSAPTSRRVRVRSCSAKAPAAQPTWRREGGRLVRV